MSKTEGKRTRRTSEELAAAIDEQILKLEDSITDIEVKKQEAADSFDSKIEAVRVRIKTLEEKKAALLAPKPPRKPRMTKKQKVEAIIKKAGKSGMSPNEIAAALGIDVEDSLK